MEGITHRFISRSRADAKWSAWQVSRIVGSGRAERPMSVLAAPGSGGNGVFSGPLVEGSGVSSPNGAEEASTFRL